LVLALTRRWSSRWPKLTTAATRHRAPGHAVVSQPVADPGSAHPANRTGSSLGPTASGPRVERVVLRRSGFVGSAEPVVRGFRFGARMVRLIVVLGCFLGDHQSHHDPARNLQASDPGVTAQSELAAEASGRRHQSSCIRRDRYQVVCQSQSMRCWPQQPNQRLDAVLGCCCGPLPTGRRRPPGTRRRG
jgi:hypothetical protein